MSAPQRFRKKPVVIEAMQWDGSIEGVRPIQRWANDSAGTASTIVLDTTGVMAPYLAVRTLEGEMRCGPGDWIIRGVQGEFYPCNPDIFDATYEPAGGV